MYEETQGEAKLTSLVLLLVHVVGVESETNLYPCDRKNGFSEKKALKKLFSSRFGFTELVHPLSLEKSH